MDLPFASRIDPEPWRIEFDAFARAIGGAVLFGIPLLFTMEMWWIGEYQSRLHLLGFVLLAFTMNVALARMSGFRDDYGSWRRDVQQAVEATGVGVVLSLVVLLALGRIDGDTSLMALYGMVAIQVVPLSVGSMVGNLVFDPSRGRTGDGDDDDDDTRTPLAELGNDVAATFVGAMFVGFAIAPTEEIPMLAADLAFGHVLGLVALSMFASYVIVFASGFDRTHRRSNVGGLFQHPFSETMLCFVVSLFAAFVLLYGFDQVSFTDPLHVILLKVIVLNVPASIGGAAGRVVV